MKKILCAVVLITLFITIAGFTICSLPDYEVPFPDGYRKWTHIKTGLIGPQSPAFQSTGGYHHIYGNDKAMEGFASGKFPEGSILVFDVIEAIEKDGSTIEGKRKHVDVMIKDNVKYSETGGWGYEEFKDGSKTLTAQVKTACFNCHAKQPDHVFSELRD